MGAKGHIKGPNGEREVVSLVKPWWRLVEPEALFVRTPKSGGWLDEEHRAEFKTTGDIMTNAEKWPFDIEVKWREGWSEAEFIAGRLSPVWGWWRQCQIAAWPRKAEPMLWFRRNRRPWMVLLRETFVESLFYGRPVDTLPPTLCSQCVKPLANGCLCVTPRPGSGCLGHPLHRWGEELKAIQYGPATPVMFYAADLLAVNPSRFIKNGYPERCPVCGSELRGVRGAPAQNRKCASKCGWEFTVAERRFGWLT